ncbi:hypothetical protein L571_1419 [Bordetella pertussis 2371640]|nr:hypothetical protein L571_1419 [Bordetella pertussis 2371640]
MYAWFIRTGFEKLEIDTFRFVMAERDGDRWRAVTPRRWPSDRGNWEQMRLTLARIVGSQPLPLARWARQAERAVPISRLNLDEYNLLTVHN